MFKLILKNSNEITKFIIDLSTDPIEKEFIEEYFFECAAILKVIKIEDLIPGSDANNLRNYKKEEEYMRLTIQTMPPLIVEDNIVIDGNHRLRVAKKKGLKEIMVYEVISIQG